MILTGENQSTLRETCPSAALSTTDPTQTGLRLNLDLCGERSVTNCLNHDMAHSYCGNVPS